jgi:3-hydroxybutyryl-CoA dehydratase
MTSFETRGRTITESDLVQFAALTGDWHPQHADATWAQEGPFGERIAHGMLVLSYAIGLAPIDPERVIALRRVREVTFKRPVRLGDTIHVEGAVAELKPIDDETQLAVWAWSVVNQHGRTVLRATIEAVQRRDAGAAGAEDRPALEAVAGVVPL